ADSEDQRPVTLDQGRKRRLVPMPEEALQQAGIGGVTDRANDESADVAQELAGMIGHIDRPLGPGSGRSLCPILPGQAANRTLLFLAGFFQAEATSFHRVREGS